MTADDFLNQDVLVKDHKAARRGRSEFSDEEYDRLVEAVRHRGWQMIMNNDEIVVFANQNDLVWIVPRPPLDVQF